MSWFLVILFLSLTFGTTHSEASHNKKLPSAVVVGTVYCDTCFQQDFSMGNHFISGASVAVECKDGYETTKPRFQKEVKTDEHGEFKVKLPFSVSKHVKSIKGCTVKLINSSEPYCAVASAATSSSLRLKSRKQGLHIFSAGFFSFKPLKQPNLCNQKPSNQNAKGLDSVKTIFPPKIDPSFPPPLQDPKTPGGLLPPIPGLPDLPPLLPPLPLLPPVLGISVSIPVPPRITNKSPKVQPLDQKIADPNTFSFPPNPLFPPPTVPNPFQPPSLNPNPLQPPETSPIVPNPFPFPTVPGLTPSPSPPAFPFPFPPLFPPPSSLDTSSTFSKNASP
ncbi:leucine-rich repeat extensin-like protein 3 [Vigna umbellata]|uniref:leucine-rich repeat extensin-like protein 3 n=1 Tax=Vigna umbellata TaxID=87088 RepID=UPI001F5FF36C|nr:leucine-rich repeat extensin-like protein 3 [Vigna umbellata]